MEANNKNEITLNHEESARLMLIERYKQSYGAQINEKVALLLELDGYMSRFKYLRSVLKDDMKSLHNILISGYGAGSEMIVARNFGFQEIHGVEVDPSLMDVTKIRLAELPGMFPALYNGVTLPYKDEQFDIVVSGHIIEHTQSPKDYLHETLRVLKTGGFLYLEFPTRYHYIELHTGLPSFEWLPTTMRNSVLRLITSRFSLLSSTTKSKYNSILSTGLKQISRRGVFLLLKQLGLKYYEAGHETPVPGYTRMVIKKL